MQNYFSGARLATPGTEDEDNQPQERLQHAQAIQRGDGHAKPKIESAKTSLQFVSVPYGSACTQHLIVSAALASR